MIAMAAINTAAAMTTPVVDEANTRHRLAGARQSGRVLTARVVDDEAGTVHPVNGSRHRKSIAYSPLTVTRLKKFSLR
jgi:hypothetical protein